ncbi:MAG: 2-iminoacetate synthase ThiH, partial [Verrucomicrobiota bacterium]
MSFVAEFNSLPWSSLVARSLQTSVADARAALGKEKLSLADFAALISPAAGELLEPLSRRSQALTQQRFGKTIRLFAPLYLSNECINNCAYCGFSRDNAILRVTLSVPEVMRETRSLAAQGFRNILLVAGEHPKFVSNGYMAECVAALHQEIPSVSLEVGPM